MRLKMLTKEERKANEQFNKVVVRLNSKKEAERLAAIAELREQWPDSRQRLLSSYQAVTTLWKKRWRIVAYSLLWLIAGNIVAGYFILHAGYKTIFPIIQVFWWPLWLSVIFALHGPKVRGHCARNLLIFDDVEIVGPLVDALAFRDEVVKQEARQALVRLLPRLQAGDANLLNGEQREQLRRMLFTDYTELAVSILKAYEHIGDGAELEVVERLLENAIWNVEVRDAAEACLPFLQLRAQQMQSSQTLLRASQPVATPDMLLRPAGNTPTQDQTQLLRMSGSES